MITITARLIEDGDAGQPTEIDLLHPVDCDHIDTMCSGCVDTWAQDWAFDRRDVKPVDPAPATEIQAAQMLIGELAALGYDAVLEHLGGTEWAVMMTAGDGVWVATAGGTLTWYEHPAHFLTMDMEPWWSTYLPTDVLAGVTPAQVAIWVDRLFVDQVDGLPTPARTVLAAKAPAFTRRDTYAGKWMITPKLDGKSGRRASVLDASELASLIGPYGIIWQSFGHAANGREGFCRTRYIAQADGGVVFYNSEGGMSAGAPAGRGIRLLAKV